MRFIKRKWDKKLLYALIGILGLSILMIIVLLLWLNTWKTYKLSNNQVSFRYPQSWTLTEDKISGYTDIKNGKNTISLAYYVPSGMTAEQEAILRAEEISQHFHSFVPKEQLNIGGQKAYSVVRDDLNNIFDQYIEIPSNGYVYELQIYSIDKTNFNIWNNFIISSVLRSIKFTQ